MCRRKEGAGSVREYIQAIHMRWMEREAFTGHRRLAINRISGTSPLKREAIRFRLPERTDISEALQFVRTRGKTYWSIRSRR